MIKKEICIIIPAYNEAEVLGEVIDSLPKQAAGMPVKVVVVDDGSTDNTAKVASAKAGVIVVRHIVNSGAGSATRTGLRYARESGFKFAITMDADGQHAADDVIKVIESITNNKADFIIGSRLINPGGMPRKRVIGNQGLNLISFMLFGIRASDVQSGLRGFNRTALNKIKFNSGNFAFCPEMIWSAKLQKLRIAEVSIKAIYTDYSLGKGQLGQPDIAAGIKVVRQLIKRRLIGLIDG